MIIRGEMCSLQDRREGSALSFGRFWAFPRGCIITHGLELGRVHFYCTVHTLFGIYYDYEGYDNEKANDETVM